MMTARMAAAAYTTGLTGSGCSNSCDSGITATLIASALTTPGSAIDTIISESRVSPVLIRLSTSSSRRLTNWDSTL